MLRTSSDATSCKLHTVTSWHIRWLFRILLRKRDSRISSRSRHISYLAADRRSDFEIGSLG